MADGDETAPDEPSHVDIDREEDIEPEEERRRIDLVLKSLPLIERDLYLGMQAMNLTVVDSMIEEMEENLLAEYIQLERTPVPSVMAVSALSQLWIFGVYELLRTWRQRLQDVLSFADEVSALPAEELARRIAAKEVKLNDRSHDPLGRVPHAKAFRRAAVEDDYRESIRIALYHSEIPFRRIEALRVHLAKHEIPRRRGLYGAGAGYSRINHDGSIQYHVPLGNREVDLITRRQIADDLRHLADDRPVFVLSPALQERVKRFEPYSYGIKRVILQLADGATFEASIAWNRYIVFVRGYDLPPFDPTHVVDLAEVRREEPDEELEAEP